MATKVKKRKLSSFGRLDAEQGRKMRQEESRLRTRNRKRLKEWTTITGSKQKTKWAY